MRFLLLTAILATAALAATPCAAFFTTGRWSATATDGPTSPAGFPATVTWSIVPDGTPIPGKGPSNFVAFMDGLIPGGSGSDLTQRPWFPLVDGSFNRWTELGGLTFVYEPVDDGFTQGSFVGSLGHRGDVRIGGAFLDGAGGTLAQTAFLDNGDVTVDTSDTAFFGASTDNYLNLRNNFTHEFGHALGLGHSDSSTAAFLMEPFSSTAFDGPQYDDIRGLHQLYGDAYEKVGAGNGTLPNAYYLGLVPSGTTSTLGGDTTTGVGVDPSERDFVSISNSSDLDYFSFSVSAPSLVDVTLTPTGPNYQERFSGGAPYTTTSSSRASDLSIELYDPAGGSPILLASASSAPLGQTEFIVDSPLAQAGQYVVRIAGSTSVIQMYKLDIHVDAVVTPGDFDQDGDVDGADLLVWQQGLGTTYDESNLADWQTNFGLGGAVQAAVGGVAAVPEPATGLAACLGILAAGRRRPEKTPKKRA